MMHKRSLWAVVGLVALLASPVKAGKLVNRAMMGVSGTPGTGTITLGSAVTGFQTFAAAGVANGDVVSYIIEDGTNWEYGQGTYTSSGTTLARTTVQGSSNAGSAITATANARVFLSALAADIVTPTTSITCSQQPALTGSVTTSAGSCATTAEQDGGATTASPPTPNFSGTAPTAHSTTWRWKKWADHRYIVNISWNVTNAATGTSGFVSWAVPNGISALPTYAACPILDATTGTAPAGVSVAYSDTGGKININFTSPPLAHNYIVQCEFEV